MSLMRDQVVRVATCNQNQWAMDFELNFQNIASSLSECVKAQVTYRTGPELEMCGYSCEDHFFEADTEAHCWDLLAELLKDTSYDGLQFDVGMPVTHNGTRYNCRVWCYNGEVVGIRPKLVLANDGNYRETRWFTGWNKGALASFYHGTAPPAIDNEEKEYFASENLMLKVHSNVNQLDWFPLPDVVAEPRLKSTQPRNTNKACPFGVFIVDHEQVLYASEICEELFTSARPSNLLYALGVNVISNGSGSHHEQRKFQTRLQLISSAANNGFGCYVYANQRGCDGNRQYFDGSSCIYSHEGLLAQAAQFHVLDTQVVYANVDISHQRRIRGQRASYNVQAQSVAKNYGLPILQIHTKQAQRPFHTVVTLPRAPKLSIPEEEIAYAPACWLWDYLRRSGAGGFFQPLSGGADSAATATIVGFLCSIVTRAYNHGVPSVQADVQRLYNNQAPPQLDAKEFCKHIFFTTYMGTQHSSLETRQRAAALSEQLGSTHMDMAIDTIVTACVDSFSKTTGFTPRFNGDYRENLALQNIQARVRMVQSYLQAQLQLCASGRPGMLLVLGSANVDEALRGFLTKYDCSSADINPIGGICKLDQRRFLHWASNRYPVLESIAAAKATPEQVPNVIREDGSIQTQISEEDMGLTFEELGVMARQRKIRALGPVGMYKSLTQGFYAIQSTHDAQEESLFPSMEDANTIKQNMAPEAAATLVKKFMRLYSINRHKSTVLTPALHAESYSPDDNRFDLRPFLYNIKWVHQFRQIDKLVQEANQRNKL